MYSTVLLVLFINIVVLSRQGLCNRADEAVADSSGDSKG